MRTVLIGKERRVTLEELQSVALYDGQLEMHASSTPGNSNDGTAAATTSTAQEDIDAIASALSNLDLNTASSNSSSDASNALLSPSETLAALTLFALNVAQNRIHPSTSSHYNYETASAIVQLVNTVKEKKMALSLSTSPAEFLSTLVQLIPTYKCVIEHVMGGDGNGGGNGTVKNVMETILGRTIPLAITCTSSKRLALVASSAASGGSIVDALAALSVERGSGNGAGVGVDVAACFAESVYGQNRPHRGMVSSATLLRVITQGSKFGSMNAANNSNSDSDNADATATLDQQTKGAIETIPSYHGPVSDALPTALKVLELECNCFETTLGINKGTNIDMDTTVVEMTARTVLNACTILLDGCKARIGIHNDSDATATDSAPGSTLIQVAMELSKKVQLLYGALGDEIETNVQFIQEEVRRASEAARKKAEEKAARAAALKAANAAAGSGAGGEKKDEFEGMTEAQKKKILKKRAEKEAKAAKKAAKKGGGAAGGGDVSIFGPGTMAIVAALTSSSSSSSSSGEDKYFDAEKIAKLESIIAGLLSGGVQRKPKIAKGTRDYLPEQMMIRDQAFQIIRRVFKSHGAVEIDTPVFELKETLTGKYGEDSKLIYDLADQGGELLALRYDLTVPFARFLSLNPVGNIKRFHIGKVYRRDQPQLSRGRYREFYQCDFDIAGIYGRMVPDSECLCVASEILASLPIGDFGIKLNHRRLLDAILDLCGVPSDKFRTICSAVDKLDKEPWSEVKREMVEDKGLEPSVADKIGTFVVQKGEPWQMYNQLMDSKAFGTHKGALEAMEDLRILFQYLEAMDKLQYISFDLSLARGLDYYTGVIYEAVCMNGNSQVGSIGGGGRYDNLVSMFQEAGNITPCVGVSVGIERVFTLMEERLRQEQGGSIKQPNVKVLVAQAGENMMLERMKVAKLLWDAKISAEFSQQENPKLKHQIVNALDRDIPFMVIIGEEEAKDNKCKIKDLKRKTEETVDQSQLASTLRSKGVIPVGCEFAAEMLAAESAE